MSKNRPYEHIKEQKQVKQLEEYQCLVCGIVTQKFVGHHLIPYSEGGSADIQNMATLCQDCHIKYHSGELKINIRRF